MSEIPYQTREGTRYTAKFQLQGKVVQKRGFKTKRAAKDWIVLERKRLKDVAKRQVQEETFSGLCHDYIKDLTGRQQENTIRQKNYVYARFIGHLQADLPLSSITQKVIESYHRFIFQEANPKTANRHLRDIRALFTWALRKGRVETHPARNIQNYPEDPYRKYVPTPADVKAVLLAADREQMDLLLTYYHTGARQREIFQLRKDSNEVDLQNKVLWLWSRKGRGEKKYRALVMNDILKEIVTRKMKEAPDSPWLFTNPRTGGQYTKVQSTIKHMMHRLCEKAGVKHFTLHALRHHVASILLDGFEAGTIAIKDLQQFLGHTRVSTTDTYIHSLNPGNSRIAEALMGTEPKADRKVEGE